jgi:hypothetical protein
LQVTESKAALTADVAPGQATCQYGDVNDRAMEIELRLSLEGKSTERWKAHLRAQGAERQLLRAVYFDTDDGRLATAGLSLRLRCENGQWVQPRRRRSRQRGNCGFLVQTRP